MPEPECPIPPAPPDDCLYRQIVSSAIDYAIITCQGDGCITSWNEGATALTGWRADEVLGRSVHCLYPPEDVSAGVPERQLAQAAQDDHAAHEGWHLRRDGSRFWASGELMRLRGDAGRPGGFVKIVRDRTAQRQQALDLQFLSRASDELAALSDYEATLDKIARLAVPAFADFCSVDMLEAGRGLRRVAVSVADPAKQERVQALHRRFPPDPKTRGGTWHVLTTGQPQLVSDVSPEVLERAIPRQERRAALIELGLRSYIAVPLSAQGESLGVLSFASAESGRRYNEADLALAVDLGRRAAVALQNARLLRALREADRAKDVFMATLAHELRNPLAPIWNGLSLLQRLPGDRARVEQVTAMIERQVGQLSRLVDDLLDASRIAMGKMALRKEPTSLVRVLATAVETSRPHIEAAHHELRLSFGNQPSEVMADPVRLAQVFANLLNNAAKYTPRGGRIEVAVAADEAELRVHVRDNGAGIAPEMLRRIFGLFTQVPQLDEHCRGGLGIGLSLAEGLVRLHGGRIEVRSDGLGRGSEFIVTLPRLARGPGATPRAPPPAEAAARGPARRVLVVDDNHDAASTVADLLALAGSEVQVAHDGVSAVERTADFRPDVVLLDIGLPDISGYEAARRIRALAGVRQPTLIALTGWGQQQDKDMATQAGFDQHWTKPVDPQRLLALAGQPAPSTSGDRP